MGMGMTIDNAVKTQAFKLKGRLHTFTVLHLLTVNIDLIDEQLKEVVHSAPRMFDKAPIVIELSSTLPLELDLISLCKKMRHYGLLPIAVSGNHDYLSVLADSALLPILHLKVTQDKAPTATIENQTHEVIKSKLVTTPVRSGQQVVSKERDLVITSSVSHGAELLSDGNIHVYGALRGRALAGIDGDKQARIFCQSLDAELVSIAGFYCLSDKMKPMNSPCQIFLLDDKIQIEAL